ncbi:MAG TPA: HPr family phosphocarrier protein [Acholeplasmataceae bacterium]|jgi:phosphocarrier protein|nr:HPr family phosphocarrier protein [Acholeplasmataceae bacterium]
MKEKAFIITSKEGLHARPAAKIAQHASKYHDRIDVIYKQHHMTLKSIIGIMSLGIPEGASFVIQTEGHHEDQILEEINQLLLEEGLIE